MSKMPIWPTVAASYRFTFGHIGRIIALIWLPALILVAGSYFLELPYLRLIQAHGADGEALLRNSSPMLGHFANVLVSLLATAMILAAIAREILQPKEGSALFRLPPPGAVLRILGSYAGLIGVAILLVLAMMLLAILAGSAAKMAGIGGVVPAVVVVMYLLLIYCVVRLSFFIAPVVVEERRFGLERSWKLSRGNFWRIVLMSLMTTVPIMLVSAIVFLVVLWPDIHAIFAPLVSRQEVPDPAQIQSAFMGMLVDNFPLLTGLQVLFMPFLYGLSVSPAAFAYRSLTEETNAS